MSFCVSVGVLRHATPVAGCVVEFVGGGPGGVGDWRPRVFTAQRNGGEGGVLVACLAVLVLA